MMKLSADLSMMTPCTWWRASALLVRRIPGPVTRDRARIDAKVGARDHLGVVRREKCHGPSIVARARQLLHRHAPAKRFERLLELIAVADRAAPSSGALQRLRRIGRGRCQAVDADAVRDQFHRGRAREIQKTALAGAVRDIVRLALMSRGRNNIDDAAFATLFDYRLGDVLREKECSGENDLELTLPFVEWHVEHAFLVEDDGAVYQDVDARERLARSQHGRDDLTLVGDVAGYADRAAARALDVARAVGGIFRARIDADQRGALGCETLGNTAADIRAGPGDQCNFSFQSHLGSPRFVEWRSLNGAAAP